MNGNICETSRVRVKRPRVIT